MHYTCSKCGLQTDVVEDKSMTEKLCEHCEMPIAKTPQIYNQSFPTPLRRKISWAILIIIGFISIDIIGVLMGLLLPSIQGAREANRRATCINHQMQISLALLSYESEKGHFPPAYITDKDGKPMHSWRILILPYLDKKDLYDQYDFNESWDGPHNRKLADKMPDVFRCPSNTNSPNYTAYAMLVGPHAFSPGPMGRTYKEISHADGASTTLMLVEATKAKINWLEPRDLNAEEMSFIINKSGKEISSNHPSGAVVSFCDGHTTFLRANIKPETLKALTTVDGHEPLDEGDF